jgi:hypothetical protein
VTGAMMRVVLQELEPRVVELRAAAAVGAPVPPLMSVDLLDRMLVTCRRVRMAKRNRDAVQLELAGAELERMWADVQRAAVEAACEVAVATAPSCDRGAL